MMLDNNLDIRSNRFSSAIDRSSDARFLPGPAAVDPLFIDDQQRHVGQYDRR